MSSNIFHWGTKKTNLVLRFLVLCVRNVEKENTRKTPRIGPARKPFGEWRWVDAPRKIVYIFFCIVAVTRRRSTDNITRVSDKEARARTCGLLRWRV